MKIRYEHKTFRDATLQTMAQAIKIVEGYQAQGYVLTLRQLFYQFVARALVPNTERSYDRIGRIVGDARLNGFMDWDAIEDRTRNLSALPYWATPADIVDAAAESYRTDVWGTQPHYVEVWIEKEALAGVFQRVCEKWAVPFFSCRGYVSLSELHVAAQRISQQVEDGHQAVILHFGDHDPSGMDMTRNIRDRMVTFECEVEVERLALNMDQVEKYQPPPNPTKMNDSRADEYVIKYGGESWELDALEPAHLAELVENRVLELLDTDAWEAANDGQEEERQQLQKLADQWEDIATDL